MLSADQRAYSYLLIASVVGGVVAFFAYTVAGLWIIPDALLAFQAPAPAEASQAALVSPAPFWAVQLHHLVYLMVACSSPIGFYAFAQVILPQLRPYQQVLVLAIFVGAISLGLQSVLAAQMTLAQSGDRAEQYVQARLIYTAILQQNLLLALGVMLVQIWGLKAPLFPRGLYLLGISGSALTLALCFVAFQEEQGVFVKILPNITQGSLAAVWGAYLLLLLQTLPSMDTDPTLQGPTIQK